ncbi:Cysteinyl-tRNA synthetase [Hordeum vulgare]|nr:Cysteinyl-tRNA synthetase [Hordeum vulgare]
MPPTPGFNIKQAEAEFAIAQSKEKVEQWAILKSIQDEAYVDANRRFIRQERAATGALFAELYAEMGAEAGAEEPEQPREHELQLSSMYP